jgi:homoserine kinase
LADTTIPLSVGLAGSSAIVIAALRVLMRSVDDAMSTNELAVAALAIESRRHADSRRFCRGCSCSIRSRRAGAAMDATFDTRASILDLARGHVEMIEAARAVGAYANCTGSGRSVVVLAPSAGVEAAARQSLNKLGCIIVSIETASPDIEPGAG